ncbi:FCD domain-containing protein, partial [Blastomonas sp.]|uniref:FCD domain-containing protein n=1 Tax=Blastomonas sp. TaxID=1909299 RepID=UPI00359487E9
YIVSNIGSFGEDIYKIGMTRRLEPMDRIYELSGASVPFRFDVHAIILIEPTGKVSENMTRASRRAFETIRELILTGSLAPGEAITEAELSALAKVSRTPVREALRELENGGLVTRSDTGRLTVSTWQSEDLEDLFSLRTLVEGYAAERAATRISPAEVSELREVNEQLHQAVREPVDIAAFLDANRRFHDIIIRASASNRAASVLARLVEQPIVSATAHRYDESLFQSSYDEHTELIIALDHGDPVWAKAIMTMHIRRAHNALAKLKGTSSAKPAS